jgi:hypothetical protein
MRRSSDQITSCYFCHREMTFCFRYISEPPIAGQIVPGLACYQEAARRVATPDGGGRRRRLARGSVLWCAGSQKKNPSCSEPLADSFRMPLVSIVSPEGERKCSVRTMSVS